MQIRRHLEALPPYTPIEPFEVLSARLGRKVEEIVKLDANENPYGPLPQVREALANLPYAHIYPDPESRALRKGLAEFTGLPMDFLLAGAGADELIDLLMRVFLDAGDRVLICPPTFGMYAFDGQLNHAQVIEAYRRDDFSLDIEAIRRQVRQYSPKLTFIASPNNPDGSLLPSDVLDEILDLPTLVVLDEAYIEFADPAGTLGRSISRMNQVPLRRNLVVLRTFSKWAGLAGLRVGYGAFPEWLMPTLWKAKQPYNVNVAASAAALISLEYQAALRGVVERICQERERLMRECSRFPFLKIYPSSANYVLMQVFGIEAAELKRRLAQEFGILVRHFNTPRLQDHIRISIGKAEDTEALVQALKTLSKEILR